MKYTVDYFIEKFEEIPDTKWATKEFETSDGTYCALGHCGVQRGKLAPIWTEEGTALQDLAKAKGLSIPQINDNGGHGVGSIEGYTPKERILNFLYSLKK